MKKRIVVLMLGCMMTSLALRGGNLTVNASELQAETAVEDTLENMGEDLTENGAEAVTESVTENGAQDSGVIEVSIEDPEILHETEGDFTYTTDSGGRAIIKGYSGSDTEVTIPEKLGDHTVVEIGTGAFAGNKTIQTIHFPDSVTCISSWAFANCSSLENLTLPKNLTKMYGGAFYNCDKITSIEIPKGLTEMERSSYWEDGGGYRDGAFEGCDGLKKASFAEGTTTVAHSLFQYCPGLEEVTIPGTVGTIGYDAFFGCGNLGKVTFEDGILVVGQGAFADCTKLTEVVLADSITEIYAWAFAKCSSLENVTLPKNLTKMYGGAFYNCDKIAGIEIPKGLTEIERSSYWGDGGGYRDGAFEDCNGLKKASFAEGTTIVLPSLFQNCSGLEEITIPNTVTTIGASAFENCVALKKVVLPGGVRQIKDKAFASCSRLAEITILKSTTEIAKNAFSNPERLTIYGTGGSYAETYAGEIGATFVKIYLVTEIFNDVKATDWYVKAIQYVYDNNVMSGKGTDFAPNANLTREEFAQVLYNHMGKPTVDDSALAFPDVQKGGWYRKSVAWVYEKNIASGNGDGTFGVGENITREQLAMMLYKYAVLRNFDQNLTAGKTEQYADKADVSSWAKNAMDWAITQEIMSGKGKAGDPISNFKLDPKGSATRAECASMMKKLLEKNAN